MRAIPLLALSLLAACAAGSNPPRPETSRWRQPQEAGALGADEKSAPGSVRSAAEPQAPVADAPVAESPSAGADPVIARIGDRTLGVSRLLSIWMHTNSREVSALLERLVTAETVEIEARRLRIELDLALIEAAYDEVVEELESDLRERRPGTELDHWVRMELGLEPAGYRQGLRADARRRLLGERLVRGFVMTHERAVVRVIVTETRADMQAVEAALSAGRPFDEVARALSLDPSKEKGGRIPPILRTQSALSRLAFLTGVGELGGPIQDTEGGRWMLLKVDAIEAPLEGNWASIGPPIEASLRAEPVQDAEYWQWKAEMTRRYSVDLEPFFALVERAEP